jgi:hypothetical protein
MKLFWPFRRRKPRMMEPFGHSKQYHAYLAEFLDAPEVKALMLILLEAGYPVVDKWSGVGGSQAITVVRFDVDGEILSLESETYIGVHLYGPRRETVDALVAQARQRAPSIQDSSS